MKLRAFFNLNIVFVKQSKQIETWIKAIATFVVRLHLQLLRTIVRPKPPLVEY